MYQIDEEFALAVSVHVRSTIFLCLSTCSSKMLLLYIESISAKLCSQRERERLKKKRNMSTDAVIVIIQRALF